MKIELRDQWEFEKGSTVQVTAAPAPESDAMGPEDDNVPVPTISPVEAANDEAVTLANDPPRTKPKVLIIATGGTIAGRGLSPTQSAGYEPGVICVEDLVQAVPNLRDVADISTHQACMVGSPDLPSQVLIELAQLAQNELGREELDAIVITHGTDTLEETSFFLDLTVFSSKPVVVTGAMLPSTSLSADGPKNLYEAVCVGANPASRDRGVLVVFNGSVMPARFTVKSDANMIQTFDPGHQGCLGQVVDDTPLYYWPPARPLGHRYIDIRSLNPKDGLPKVGILYGHLGVDEEIFRMYVQGGVQGLVLAGMGAGCWSNKGRKQLDQHIGPDRAGNPNASEPLLPVVTSFRTVRGCVSLKKDIFGVPDWVIRAGFLNPAKACKLLQVCLAVGMSHQEIKSAFSMDACSA
jgi:L-asparaginase